MVANTRCTQIMEDQLNGLKDDPSWQALSTEAQEGLVGDFGERAFGLIDSCFSGCVYI